MKNQEYQGEVYIGEIKDQKEMAALINGNLMTTHHASPATDAKERLAKEIEKSTESIDEHEY